MSDTELLKIMNGKLDELLVWKATIDERCKAHREKTDEVREVLFDNPSGIKLKVERLWNCKQNLSDSRIFWRNFFAWILKALIVSGILSLAGWYFV